jgi:carbon monoxide dehydrogenase subunit G
MKKILGIAALVLVVAVAGVLLYATTQPDTFRVARSQSIKASPDKIYAYINDFRSWPGWSPYEKKDPAMKRTLSGPPAGMGAVYAWEGNGDVGQGRMEIVEAKPASKVGIKLDFIKPFEAHNMAEFTLEPRGDATQVTWAIHGPMPYISKVMCLFLDMDKMIGRDFEVGLANLKAATEG